MKKLRSFYYLLALTILPMLSSCTGITNYFDHLGESMPTYDKCFGNDPGSRCFGRNDAIDQPQVVKHTLPADAARPQSPDVDKYLQQQQ